MLKFFFFLAFSTLTVTGQFTTVVGDQYPYSVSATTTDSAGNTYVVGNRQGAPSPNLFVSKLDPNGTVLFTSTIGGTGSNVPAAIAVDQTRNIYIAGETNAIDFPLIHALQPQYYPLGADKGAPTDSGFIVKLSADGSTVLYSTYFGGTLGQSAITSLAIDANSNLYLTGWTLASDYPHTPGMPFGALSQNPQAPGAIIASISPGGDKILYAGAIPMATPSSNFCCFSLGIEWEGVAIAVDAAGNAYVAGNDASSSGYLPTTPGAFVQKGIGGFVAKINAGGTGLGYLTYIASGSAGTPPLASPGNTIQGMTADATGSVYLIGTTFDPNFPISAGAYQTTPSAGTTSGFVAKLNSDGSALDWATYFPLNLQAIALDGANNVWVTGKSFGPMPSPSLPNANNWTTGSEFVASLNSTGSALNYSALYPSGTVAQSLVIEPSGVICVAGQNGFISQIAPNTPPAMKIFGLQNAALGNFTNRVSPAEVVAIYGPGIGPATQVTAVTQNGFYPTSLGGVQVTANGVNIPLLYVSSNQINAVMPMSLAFNTSVAVHVTNSGVASPDFPLWIDYSAPLAFPVTLNQDRTINSQSNPATAGSIVSFWATGWQSNFAPLADGETATGAQDVCLGTCQASALGGAFRSFFPIAASVQYAGAAPTLVAGFTQFNVQVLNPVPGTLSYTIDVTNPATGATVSSGAWIKGN
jgi:uncharacterized protein (TIGR03437 family)